MGLYYYFINKLHVRSSSENFSKIFEFDGI